MMNDDEPEEESADIRAQHQAEVQDLIEEISKDTSLAMTAETEEMVESLRAKVGSGIWDTGCRKTVAGSTWIHTCVQALAGLGIPI